MRPLKQKSVTASRRIEQEVPAQDFHTLSQRLVARCAISMTDADLTQASRLLLDWFGNCVAAHGEPAALATSRFTLATAFAGPCTALTLGSAGAESAAFANGSLGTLLEMDDLDRASLMHAGDVVIPAALAASQAGDCSGRQLLEAIVIGYQVALSIGRAASAGGYSAWYNSATCGVFGAATAAAHALGATSEQQVDAIGQAGMQAAGLWQCRLEPTDSKSVATAHAARAGVTSAFLAINGARGARAILEGELGFFPTFYPTAILDGVTTAQDGRWMIHDVSFKPWSACRHVHPAVGLAVQLRGNVLAEHIQSVAIETYAAAIEFCDNPTPRAPHQARFSLQHCVASALLHGRLRISDTQASGLSDGQVAALRAKITVFEGPDITADFPGKMGARVKITEISGVTHSAVCSHALGDPEQPMTDVELAEKFRSNCTSAGLSRQDVSDLKDAIDGLVHADAIENLNDALCTASGYLGTKFSKETGHDSH